MATYDNLPVYKVSYDLGVEFGINRLTKLAKSARFRAEKKGQSF